MQTLDRLGLHSVFNLDDYGQESIEPLGTKAKFWFRHEEHGWCLCKIARANTGEHWSEVIACDLAELLNIPHAHYFLAFYKDQPAVFTPTIIPNSGGLVLGNQLLFFVDPEYQSLTRQFKQTSHTVDIVLEVLTHVMPPSGWACPSGIKTGADVFVGYLALDALIGNTDRHHENWGIVGTRENDKPAVRLAPTFDHASSLGCHETEEKKIQRLTTTDANFNCEAYAARARSAFYDRQREGKCLRTIEVFRQAMELNPPAAKIWRTAIDKISVDQLAWTIKQIPGLVMSESSRKFAEKILIANRLAILSDH